MNDTFYMSKALELANAAFSEGEVPVGAVIVDNQTGEILGEGQNQCEKLNSPLIHAEMIAIENAAKNKGTWRLFNTTLYVTLEPCAMCTGAVINSRISRVVYGAKDERAGACGSCVDLFSVIKTSFPEVVSGVCEDECKALLSDFFKSKRSKIKQKKPELWDLFDKERKPLGLTHVRGTPLAEGTYHIVILVITKNSKGQVLLTKRSDKKEKSPGMWECTTGSVLAGESSVSGACRELMEETGIKRKKELFKLIKTFGHNTYFTDCYLLKTDVDDCEIRLQKGETVAYKWADRQELEKMLSEKLMFSPDTVTYEAIRDMIFPPKL